MTIQSTLKNNPDHPKYLLTKNILRVTLLNLAMISLTSRTAKVQPTERLSDCSQVLERLSPLKQDRINKVRAQSGQNQGNQSKTKARSIPVQKDIKSSS